MQTSIRRVGNSAAVLLPKPVLAHLAVAAGDLLELDLEEGRIVLSPAQSHPRAGWAEAAQALARSGEDHLQWPEFASADDQDWEW
jgi:antitoxin MazE